MKILKITGTSSQIEIYFDGGVATFLGEMLQNGFWAYKDSMTLNYDAGVELTYSNEKIKEILDSAIKYATTDKYKLVID